MHSETKLQSLKFRAEVQLPVLQVCASTAGRVNLHFPCQAMVTELLPPDNCRWQAMVAHERWSCAVMDRSAAPRRHETGASSVHGRQDTEYEIFILILHTHHVIHVACVQEMGRDEEDLRSFTIAYPY